MVSYYIMYRALHTLPHPTYLPRTLPRCLHTTSQRHLVEGTPNVYPDSRYAHQHKHIYITPFKDDIELVPALQNRLIALPAMQSPLRQHRLLQDVPGKPLVYSVLLAAFTGITFALHAAYRFNLQHAGTVDIRTVVPQYTPTAVHTLDNTDAAMLIVCDPKCHNNFIAQEYVQQHKLPVADYSTPQILIFDGIGVRCTQYATIHLCAVQSNNDSSKAGPIEAAVLPLINGVADLVVGRHDLHKVNASMQYVPADLLPC